ncbi:MAG: hypothetical protein U0326_40925 [Polyangiales bacterium]
MSGGFLREAFERVGFFGRELLTEAIATEFVEDQFARLEEAGTTSHDRIRLTQVFVDLTVTRAPDWPGTPTLGGFRFLEAAAREFSRLDGDWVIHGPDDENPEPCMPGRVLLVGGPGQGKSTLVQHLVQAHRRRCLGAVEVAKRPEVWRSGRPHRPESGDLSGRVEGLRDAALNDDKERRAEHVPSRGRLPIVIELALRRVVHPAPGDARHRPPRRVHRARALA